MQLACTSLWTSDQTSICYDIAGASLLEIKTAHEIRFPPTRTRFNMIFLQILEAYKRGKIAQRTWLHHMLGETLRSRSPPRSLHIHRDDWPTILHWLDQGPSRSDGATYKPRIVHDSNATVIVFVAISLEAAKSGCTRSVHLVSLFSSDYFSSQSR